MKVINGGVCAPKGFTATGIHCGLKKNKFKKDLAAIKSEVICSASAVYTTNKVKAAPLYQTMENLKDGKCQAVIVNSGNANACAINGKEHAYTMCKEAAKVLNVKTEDMIVASTGVIGQELNVEKITTALPKLELTADGADMASSAIMTTDTFSKQIAIEFEIAGKTCTIGAMAKGSGMIHPNMGTMLSFVTTDCNITSAMLDKALKTSTVHSYNMVSVDGDTSTNDMCCVLASGLADNTLIDNASDDYKAFYAALDYVNTYLAKKIAADGEGATKLISCIVTSASTKECAINISKSVAASSLVKTAMFGSDANWGRVICAMGYSGEDFVEEDVKIAFSSNKGEVLVCENGKGLLFDESKAKEILLENEVNILIDIKNGTASATAWGCDLSYDYVKINGDYRS